jgi:hypothetical protein
MADQDGRDQPITWRAGRAPCGFLIAGLFLWYRSGTSNAPEDLGLLVIGLAGIIVFLRWVAQVQQALNKSWLDLADPQAAAAEEEEPEVPETLEAPAALTAPAGGT